MSKGDLTRQRIVAAAAPIFNQNGYEGASMQALMEATGLGKGGIYRHFESKEELASEAFRYAVALSVKTRTGDLAHIEGAIAKLEYVVKRFVHTPSPMPGGCPLMNTAIDSDDGNPVLRALARDSIADWRHRLSKIVQAGVKAGEIRKGIQPRQIANTIIATLEGALMISRIEGTKKPLQDARASLITLFTTIRS
ncbi:TetR/AcrR family transcriptional regulator [Terriglobus saanensis]|uniref:Regulatory protein TetR n=1 Tax=Terriglobus saanensis (strain ATCC BAA-1853 / DSM 23119 / SP1PR4) TaxID=401053 RepID=E8V847_TERSS|nr:TetR/AcrR family transcriptional regulator [Terriglobus saanensis]ADV84029.1 regulatory protein TetR [Terriglobus saanensis SP1PR4]